MEKACADAKTSCRLGDCGLLNGLWLKGQGVSSKQEGKPEMTWQGVPGQR